MAERRTDLEQVEISFPAYAIPQILPWFARKQTAGNLYYQAAQTDATAQYNRNTASLASITTNAMAAASTSFACAEIIQREEMSYDQVMGYADLAHAELAMARKARRAFYNKVESLGISAILTNAIDATSDPVAAVDSYAAKLADKAFGETALVVSNHDFVALKNNNIVKDRMKNTGIYLGYNGDPRSVTKEQLAAVFGVSRVIVGRDDLWYKSGYKGVGAVVVLPNADIDPNEEVQLGRSIYFAYDSEAEHHIVESWYDEVAKAHAVDAVGLVDIKVLNSGLKQAITLFSVDQSGSESQSI